MPLSEGFFRRPRRVIGAQSWRSSMKTKEEGAVGTPQIRAPRTTEQLIAGAASAHAHRASRRRGRSAVLAALPPEIAGNRPSLIDRNLTRGARLLLPAGQVVAAHMGAPVLSDDDLGLPDGGAAPLWYYILKEASVLGDGGRHLGPVGGRIVAEVFIGLLQQDASSYLRNQPTWRPFLPSVVEHDFTVPDLIAMSGHGLEETNLPG
ncbi:hypothetical protein CLV49_3045 [Labedella gwakjiensis]|uniref:Uncharacterized protein n=2 Tax=Labedella gwakjiensis TaxID=390269 RepID=A0A2P8GZM7_9MICO|nr:hypothetical protein CLV49_3045 [Labedella gwakjiensis]